MRLYHCEDRLDSGGFSSETHATKRCWQHPHIKPCSLLREEDGTGRLHGSDETRGIACAQCLFLRSHILYMLSATRVHSMMMGLTSTLIHNQIRGCNLEQFEREEGHGHSQAYNTH